MWTVRHDRTALRLSPNDPRCIMLGCINNGIMVRVLLLIVRFCAHMMLCFGFMTRTLFGCCWVGSWTALKYFLFSFLFSSFCLKNSWESGGMLLFFLKSFHKISPEIKPVQNFAWNIYSAYLHGINHQTFLNHGFHHVHWLEHASPLEQFFTQWAEFCLISSDLNLGKHCFVRSFSLRTSWGITQAMEPPRWWRGFLWPGKHLKG